METYSEIARKVIATMSVEEENVGLPDGGIKINAKNFVSGLLPKYKPDRAFADEPFDFATTLIRSPEELQRWIGKVNASGPDILTIDIETTGLNFASSRICGIAINTCGESAYAAFGHEDETGLTEDQVRDMLSPLFASSLPKLFHHATFDVPFLLRAGFDMRGPFYDTRLIAREVHGREVRSYGLKELACLHVHPKANYWENELAELLKTRFGSRKSNKGFMWRLPSSEVYRYACADVCLTRRLFDRLKTKVAMSDVAKAYLRLEKEVTGVIVDVARSGFKVDEPKLLSCLAERRLQIESLDRRLDELFGVTGVSYTSRLQVLELVKRLGFRPLNPETGKASVCLDALKNLKADTSEPIVALIRRRALENQVKQLSGFPANVVGGRVYSHFTISAQAGERFGSSGPSLFTGKKKAAADEVTLRHFIQPDDGCVLAFFDFNASHFRVLAHLCGDDQMAAIFRDGKDFHRAVASHLFGIRYEDVSDQQRDRTKPIGFSVIYGMGFKSLAETLGVTFTEARELRQSFLHKLFPMAGKYVESIHREVELRGFVRSGTFGVQISLPKKEAYKGLNYQIQTTEAEILKSVLVDVATFLRPYRSRIALPLHDEIVLQIASDEIHLIPQIKAIIEARELKVPFTCDVAIARDCWAVKEKFSTTMAAPIAQDRS